MLIPCPFIDLHWSESEKMYCDLGVNSDGGVKTSESFYYLLIFLLDESDHVCHKGYLSLFPFMLELLPATSPHLGHILDLVHDPEHLWSSYGIRSLSASHPEFGKGENYWKGPIWMQINYLVLRALHNVRWLLSCFKLPFILILFLLQTYTVQEGPYQAKAQTIYKELRRNVVDNVVKVRCLPMKTLFFFLKQFKSGIRTYWICMGTIRCYYRRRTKKVCYFFMPFVVWTFLYLYCSLWSHPFTGWTSLTALSEFNHLLPLRLS